MRGCEGSVVGRRTIVSVTKGMGIADCGGRGGVEEWRTGNGLTVVRLRRQAWRKGGEREARRTVLVMGSMVRMRMCRVRGRASCEMRAFNE